MTKEQLAIKLNGREYGDEITHSEEKLARDSDLIVIFGASDDLVELRGFINDEMGAYDGTTLLLDPKGVILPEIDHDEREVLEKYFVLDAVKYRQEHAIKIEANWGDNGYSWFIDTKAPHAVFDIMEEEDKFCRGIVIDLKELK